MTADDTAMMVLPGAVVWRVTCGEEVRRWQRYRRGGRPCLLPPGWAATACPYGEPAMAGKPPGLRDLWQQAEAAARWGWGWRLRPVTAGLAVIGWELVIEDPAGREHCFTWIGTELVTTRETPGDVAQLIPGPVLSEAACLLDVTSINRLKETHEHHPGAGVGTRRRARREHPPPPGRRPRLHL